MLVAFSQPHFSHYDWKAAGRRSATTAMRAHAEFYVRAAQNHPSVVFYSMSHNACGGLRRRHGPGTDRRPARSDMTPWALQRVEAGAAGAGDRQAPRPEPDCLSPFGRATSARCITTQFLPQLRPDAGACATGSTHWSQAGVKPVFMCEFGTPFTWDWSMYRGWYKGEARFGSAGAVGVLPCRMERAVPRRQRLSHHRYGETNLRWENGQYQAGNVWHRWDYPRCAGQRQLSDAANGLRFVPDR